MKSALRGRPSARCRPLPPQVVVKPNPKNTTDPALQKEAEGERVSKLIAAGSRVVMLDERGKDISSEGAPMGQLCRTSLRACLVCARQVVQQCSSPRCQRFRARKSSRQGW